MTGAQAGRRALVGIAGISAVGTILSRFTGLGRTVFQASALGANGVSDAYNLANSTPNIIYDLVLGGVLAGTLIPVFVHAMREDDDGGWEAISAVCSVVAAVLGVVTVVFLLASPWIIRFYLLTSHGTGTNAERHLAVSLLLLFVPQLAMYGLVALATAVLAARDSFAAPNYTPILNNLIVIGVLVAFGALIAHPTTANVRSNTGALLLLGLGTTAGVVAMTVALIPALRGAGVHLRWVWRPGHPAVRRIVRLSGWMAGVVVANQLALLVVFLIANHHVGDLTAYLYAYQFFLLPHAIWTVSLLTPMERAVAREWQGGDVNGARRHLIETTWSAMVLIIPASLGYAVLARPTISLILLHGNMSPHGARATADALTAFALGLPTFSIFAILVRSYQAVQDTRSIFLIYLFENVVNIVLAVVLYDRFGIRGLAASWSLAYAAAAAVAIWHLSRRFGEIGGRRLALAVGAVVAAAVPSALSAWALSTWLANLPGGTRQTGIALRLVVAVAAAVSVYFLAARALGFEEIRARLVLRRRVTFGGSNRSDRVQNHQRPRRRP
ncbi:MAG: murein biosynthesis integral membrane protein MurJ [Acidimicrobiales bacterium]